MALLVISELPLAFTMESCVCEYHVNQNTWELIHGEYILNVVAGNVVTGLIYYCNPIVSNANRANFLQLLADTNI